MYVGDILRRKSPRVVTVRMDETVGIVTDRDVLRAMADRGAAGLNMKVSQFISVPQFVSCSSKDTLESVHDVMDHHHVRHLPVVDDYSLIGVISMQEIASALNGTALSEAQAA